MSAPEWDELSEPMRDRVAAFGTICALIGFMLGVAFVLICLTVEFTVLR